MLQTSSSFVNLYNPGKQSREELMANFVIRLTEFNELMSAIRTDKMEKPCQHFLIHGQRGYGKTTLLRRLYFEIKYDPELNNWLIPISFDEEQWNIYKLENLWEDIAEKLEDENENFFGLSDEMGELLDKKGEEEQAYEMLTSALKEKNKKIIVFWDNFGQTLSRLSKKEKQRLREVLITCNCLRIIGASATFLEFTSDYSDPFYEFFKTISLDELDSKETIELLRKLGEQYKSEEINNVIEKQPERIESLRRLTNGVPRTIVLLFEIFVDSQDGNSFKDLEKLLDSVTPLYKSRMDELPPQQQKIVDAIALNWDAVSVKEIAKTTRLQSKFISAQLNLLEKNQIIKKIPTSTKNYFYQLNERFFNIWYLMRRNGKRTRNKVLWLVRFLEVWCSSEEIVERINRHIQFLQEGKMSEKYAFYMSQAYSGLPISLELQDKLLSTTNFYLINKKSTLVNELKKSNAETIGEIKNDLKNNKEKLAIKKLREINPDDTFINYTLGKIYIEDLNNMLKAEEFLLLAINKGNLDAILRLAWLYDIKFKDYKKAEQYYLMAIEKNSSVAILPLVLLYFRKRANKERALELINIFNKEMSLEFIKSIDKEIKNYSILYTSTLILLWNNEIEVAINQFNNIFSLEESLEDNSYFVQFCIQMFLAKKQYNYVHKLFSENNYEIKERLKPLYYALMSYMQDSFPDEIKKMGDELKETVDEIIDEINQMEKVYA